MKIIKFEEAMRTKILKNFQEVDPSELFFKDNTHVYLIPKVTGYSRAQVIERQEEGLKFYYMLNEEEYVDTQGNLCARSFPLIVGLGSSTMGITIKGAKKSFPLSIVASLYSNEESGIKGDTVNLNILLKLKQSTRFNQKIATSFIKHFMSQGLEEWSVDVIEGKKKKEEILMRNGKEFSSTAYYLPMIRITDPNKILVAYDKNSNRVNLIPSKGLLKVKYRFI